MTDDSINGERARQLLEDEVLQRVLTTMEDDALTAIRVPGLSDQDLRGAYLRLLAVREFRAQLLIVIQAGALRDHENEQENRKRIYQEALQNEAYLRTGYRPS